MTAKTFFLGNPQTKNQKRIKYAIYFAMLIMVVSIVRHAKYDYWYHVSLDYEVEGYYYPNVFIGFPTITSLKADTSEMVWYYDEAIDHYQERADDINYDISYVTEDETLTEPEKADILEIDVPYQEELQEEIDELVEYAWEIDLDVTYISEDYSIPKEEQIVLIEADIAYHEAEIYQEELIEEAEEIGYDYHWIFEIEELTIFEQNELLEDGIQDWKYQLNIAEKESELNKLHVDVSHVTNSSSLTNKEKSDELDRIYNNEIEKRENESFSGDIKAMSYNVLYSHGASGYKDWGTRSSNISKIMASHAPDLIGVQELKYTTDIHYLMQHMPSHYDYIEFTGESQQNGIIYNTQTMELIDSGYYRFTGAGSNGHRGVTWGVFRVKGTNDLILFATTHLTTVYDTQIVEVDQLISYINYLESLYPVTATIVVGDFNYDSVLHAKEPKNTVKTFENGTGQTCTTAKPTYPSSGYTYDYNCQKGLSHQATYTDWSYYEGGYASDHLPLISEYKYSAKTDALGNSL